MQQIRRKKQLNFLRKGSIIDETEKKLEKILTYY